MVSDVDREAEADADALLAAERPGDGIRGEEGARRPGEREWVLDALDGTLNYVQGLPGWCAAVALEGPEGTLAAAVYDPVREELFSAAAGRGARLNGAPIASRRRPADWTPRWWRRSCASPRRPPGVVATLTRLLQQAGSVRITGSGTLELAWVAAGRLHGWLQPATFAWDWLPGALLVRRRAAAPSASAPTRLVPRRCASAPLPALRELTGNA